MKPLYDDLIDVQNRIAVDAGFKSAVESWNRDYEMDDVERVADQLFERLQVISCTFNEIARGRLFKASLNSMKQSLVFT